MSLLALAIGLVLVIEGLAFALAPSRLEDVVAVIARMPRDRRRAIGLAMLAAGVVLVWLARGAV
ncbi:DUF2065 domain-containing protein [Ruixingdingia sedimenti]|uniref:DUF2065 domain-containing protein n=1 Tax=Ruixingdingia sedimenti TaxID=3073604 RepID=A0ABU1F781_9RHOB|nr:DUF2065 domain-containing protein [Xinfangfangia sp. LG-4]MDR5652508.1 DUF2065 domain-containing protein [Xinfangfangia sp. LG-4]